MSVFLLIWTEFSDIVGKFRFLYVRKKIFWQLPAQKMVDVSDTTVNNDIFVDDVKAAIKAIKE